jgi:hypothetical protein
MKPIRERLLSLQKAARQVGVFASLAMIAIFATGGSKPGDIAQNTLRVPGVFHDRLLSDVPDSQRDERLPDPSPDQNDPRRLLYAQIVEDDKAGVFVESGVIEGKPFKYFLKNMERLSHDKIRKQTNEQVQFEDLVREPGMYRGQVITLPRAVILEVSQAKLGPEYNLPGYTVLPAVAVDSLRDVYALRILCPPGSRLYEKLQKGIDDDQLPVVRISGYFMKLYARETNDPKEPPWQRPLLLCPEPEFSKAAEPRSIWRELNDTKMDRLLPSKRIDFPGAEERMIVELLPGSDDKNARVRIGSKYAPSDAAGFKKFIAEQVAEFQEHLPEEQREHPAAVAFFASGAPQGNLHTLLDALRAAGVKRIAKKREK